MRIPDYIIESRRNKKGYFSAGFMNQEGDDAVPEGAIIDGLNWIVKKDKIELRRGQLQLGADAGVGKVTGLRVARNISGTDVMFRTRARKIEYYVASTDTFTEVGTNSIAANANGEDISIEPYTSLAGYAIYLSSPNSDIYKLMLHSLDDLISMSSSDHRGRIRIKNGRMLLWDNKSNTGGKDKTGVYGSTLDKDEYSDYTAVTTEAIGSAGSVTYTGTLAFKAGGVKRSCFGVTFTGGVGGGDETFQDNFDGTLSSESGGTGTINYATGAYSITFSAVTDDVVTADYFWEDPTVDGIDDFGFSSTRVSGEGFVVRQDGGGGNMQGIGEYDSKFYCLHEKKAWELEISADDADANNLAYRDKVGIPNWRALTETGEGVYYIDTSDDNDIRLRLLRIANMSTKVVPISMSDRIDLSGYSFDSAALEEWGDYITIACRRSASTKNDRMFFFDRQLGIWNPPTDYQAHCLEVYNGALIAGDSTTNNVYELMSGWDDDDSLVNNFVTFNQTDLRKSGLKKPHRFVIAGEIQPDQNMNIYLSLDEGTFVLIGTVNGNGDYVDKGASVNVGAVTVGKNEVGGGGSGITASPYQREINITSKIDSFEKVRVKFECTGLGYCSVKKYGFKDVRSKGRKLPNKYL